MIDNSYQGKLKRFYIKAVIAGVFLAIISVCFKWAHTSIWDLSYSILGVYSINDSLPIWAEIPLRINWSLVPIGFAIMFKDSCFSAAIGSFLGYILINRFVMLVPFPDAIWHFLLLNIAITIGVFLAACDMKPDDSVSFFAKIRLMIARMLFGMTPVWIFGMIFELSWEGISVIHNIMIPIISTISGLAIGMFLSNAIVSFVLRKREQIKN